jgi:hypothetical protein
MVVNLYYVYNRITMKSCLSLLAGSQYCACNVKILDMNLVKAFL